MDTRVILNLPSVPDLSRIPELEGAKEIEPTLLASEPILHRASVSLVIPTFFSSELKRRSLRHLLSQMADSSVLSEVIIVNSDGEENTFEDLKPALNGLPMVVKQAPPHNRAASRNTGAAAARGEYLLFLDDDMVPRHWRMVDVLLSRMIEEEFECALFPRRNYARFPLLYDDWCLEQTIRHWREGGMEDDSFLFDPVLHGARDLPMLFCFPGCFMLIGKAAYERLEGFSEVFVGWGFEDTDFALRAIRELRVMNLFRKSDPLLHIDHPVSPYKSEEHRANSKTYFASSMAIDLHRFCRTVFKGNDFTGSDAEVLRRDIHLVPFRRLLERNIPLEPERMEGWAAGVADRLMGRFADPLPEFMVLHGSRASGRGRPESDYDVLCLYRGLVQDFMVTHSVPTVEIECASLQVFESLSEEPWLYDSRGVLDLAKLAQGRLLVGDEEDWESWRSNLMATAARNGRCFWLVLALGLRLGAVKNGALVERYLTSLRLVLEAALIPDDQEELTTADPAHLGAHTASVLDQAMPSWRDKVERNEKLFELQVPEVWTAFHWLTSRSAIHSPGRAKTNVCAD